MKNLFKNCIDVYERDGWYSPKRFTEKQLLVYRSGDDSFRIRSLMSASCCLAFSSSAKSIEIDYRIGEKAREWASFDVVVGGILTQTVSVEEDEGTVRLELSGDSRKETHIYLPHLVCIEVRVANADAPLMPIEKKKKLWLAIGDSITQGMVSARPSSAYPSAVSEFVGCEVINQGVGGIHFEPGELDYIGREPDLITVALGCNDWDLFPLEEFKMKVDEYLRRLLSLYSCKNIYMILPIWRNDETTFSENRTFAEHIDIIRKIAEKYPIVKTIDGYSLLPHTTAIYGDPEDPMVHPNDEGFFLYSLALLRKLPIEILRG